MELELKSEPFTIIVKAPVPAVTELGEIEEIVGVIQEVAELTVKIWAPEVPFAFVTVTFLVPVEAF
jgi:hypothetical protein